MQPQLAQRHTRECAQGLNELCHQPEVLPAEGRAGSQQPACLHGGPGCQPMPTRQKGELCPGSIPVHTEGSGLCLSSRTTPGLPPCKPFISLTLFQTAGFTSDSSPPSAFRGKAHPLSNLPASTRQTLSAPALPATWLGQLRGQGHLHETRALWCWNCRAWAPGPPGASPWPPTSNLLNSSLLKKHELFVCVFV